MKDAYYFPHDSNAKNDPKILAMLSVYGMQGYGWYWVIIEMLREQNDYKMDICGKYSFNAFAMQMLCDAETAEKFIMDCINEFKLFESDGNYFWSNSLIRRMKNKEEKSEKARQSALKRWNRQDNANAMQTHSKGNAIKEKEIKEKENINNISPPVGPPQNVTLPDETMPKDLSCTERESLNILKHTPGYPFNYEKDLTLIRDMSVEFPEIDILEELKKWAHRKKYEDPLTKKSKPRGQIRNWLIKAREFKQPIRARPAQQKAVNYDDVMFLGDD